MSPMPKIPDQSKRHVDADAAKVVAQLMPWVRYHLRAALTRDIPEFRVFEDTNLHNHAPLSIKAALKDGELASFMAPWTKEACTHAFDTTGMYQAGGNIFWVSRNFDDTDPSYACVHGDAPTWDEVLVLVKAHFTLSDTKGRTVERLVFQIPLAVYGKKNSDFDTQESFDAKLLLLGGKRVRLRVALRYVRGSARRQHSTYSGLATMRAYSPACRSRVQHGSSSSHAQHDLFRVVQKRSTCQRFVHRFLAISLMSLKS